MSFLDKTLKKVKQSKHPITIEGYIKQSSDLLEQKHNCIRLYEQINNPKQAEAFKKKQIRIITKLEKELDEIKSKINQLINAMNNHNENYGIKSKKDTSELGDGKTAIEECYDVLKACKTKEEYLQKSGVIRKRHMEDLKVRLGLQTEQEEIESSALDDDLE